MKSERILQWTSKRTKKASSTIRLEAGGGGCRRSARRRWRRARAVRFNERNALINSRPRSRYRGRTIKITVYAGARGASPPPSKWGRRLRKLVVRVVAAPYPTTKSCDTIGSGMSVVVVISSCFLVIVLPLSGYEPRRVVI